MKKVVAISPPACSFLAWPSMSTPKGKYKMDTFLASGGYLYFPQLVRCENSKAVNISTFGNTLDPA